MTLDAALRRALEATGLGELTWYQATRHTFASQWVMAGRSIEELKEILGHHSVVVTERYAHLRPDLFAPGALAALSLDLSPGDRPVAEIGQPAASSSAIRHACRASLLNTAAISSRLM